jgi:hypothetical protein
MIVVSTLSVSANLGTFKQNNCVQIRVLSNCSNINLTEISNSNQTYIINKAMTKIGGQTFNYTFCNTSKIDSYAYSWNDYCIDCSNGNCGNSFEITENGKQTPNGSIIITFTLIFMIIAGLSIYLVLYTLGHLISLDFDLIDLSLDWGIFIVIVVYYIFEKVYLDNTLIESVFVWFMIIAGIMLILIPSIAFILSVSLGAFTKKNNFQVPRKRRLG